VVLAAGHVDTLRCLIQHSPIDINAMDALGRSSLLLSAQAGWLQCVELLLQYGANVNLVDRRLRSALSSALSSSRFDIVTCLVRAGAQISLHDIQHIDQKIDKLRQSYRPSPRRPQHLLFSQDESDVCLVAEGKRFYAHKAILSARSEYFCALLTGHLSKNLIPPSSSCNMVEVAFDDVPASLLSIVLRFLYVGQVDSDLSTAALFDLIVLANRFLLNDLVLLCGEVACDRGYLHPRTPLHMLKFSTVEGGRSLLHLMQAREQRKKGGGFESFQVIEEEEGFAQYPGPVVMDIGAWHRAMEEWECMLAEKKEMDELDWRCMTSIIDIWPEQDDEDVLTDDENREGDDASGGYGDVSTDETFESRQRSRRRAILLRKLRRHHRAVRGQREDACWVCGLDACFCGSASSPTTQGSQFKAVCSQPSSKLDEDLLVLLPLGYWNNWEARPSSSLSKSLPNLTDIRIFTTEEAEPQCQLPSQLSTFGDHKSHGGGLDSDDEDGVAGPHAPVPSSFRAHACILRCHSFRLLHAAATEQRVDVASRVMLLLLAICYGGDTFLSSLRLKSEVWIEDDSEENTLAELHAFESVSLTEVLDLMLAAHKLLDHPTQVAWYCGRLLCEHLNPHNVLQVFQTARQPDFSDEYLSLVSARFILMNFSLVVSSASFQRSTWRSEQELLEDTLRLVTA